MRQSLFALIGLGLVSGLAVGCAIEAHSDHADGQFDQVLAVNGPVELDITSRSGRIDVRVGPVDAVHIAGRIRAYGSLHLFSRSYTPDEQARALESSPPISQHGNSIEIGRHDDWNWNDDGLLSNVTISYDVTVPPATRLRSNSRSGDLLIESVEGPVSATSRSGNVHLTGVSKDVEVETRSGNVEVSLPKDGGADLDVTTRSGAIHTERNVEIRSTKKRDVMRGTIAPGGRRVQVQTRSGSIRIR